MMLSDTFEIELLIILHNHFFTMSHTEPVIVVVALLFQTRTRKSDSLLAWSGLQINSGMAGDLKHGAHASSL